METACYFAVAETLTNAAKHSGARCTSIFAKLGLEPSDDDNRRVLAVLAYLNS